MLDITANKQGSLIAVKVVPRASRDELAGELDGALKVRLTAPPVDGAANRALIAFLAKHLGVAKSAVTVVAGQQSRGKRVAVAGLKPAELLRRLEA